MVDINPLQCGLIFKAYQPNTGMQKTAITWVKVHYVPEPKSLTARPTRDPALPNQHAPSLCHQSMSLVYVKHTSFNRSISYIVYISC